MSLALKAARSGRTARFQMVHGSRPMGDPGVFGFLGKVAKAAVGGAVGFATGGIGGAIQGAGFGARPQIQGIPTATLPGVGLVGPPGSNGSITQPRPGVIGAAQRFFPGGATGFETAACPKGFHANKADYFLKDGTFIPKGTRCVKNRSRNPLNPRALRRAVARVDAGKTWQGKLAEISTGKYTAAGNRKAKC